MKKLLLISLLVFAAAFLLWPNSKTTKISCFEPLQGEPGISVGQSQTTTTDCPLPEAVDSFGGGARYLAGVVHSNSDKTYNQHLTFYCFDENCSKIFRPQQALLGAAVAGVLTGVVIAVVRRFQKPTSKTQPLKTKTS